MKINLKDYGWDAFFDQEKKNSKTPHLEHGRVISVHKLHYTVITEKGVLNCDILGTLQFQKNPLYIPAVGDWVLVDWHAETPVIHAILGRKTILKRQKKHDTFPKPIAANVDKAVVIQSAQDDFNVKRLERILVHIRESKALPLIVINKTDLVSEKEINNIKAQLETLNTPIIYTSAKNNHGVLELINFLGENNTIVFIGSSGVGKSSLLNLINGSEVQKTQNITEKTGKGKHTTTARTLVRTIDGILIIDTPGTREFGMYGDDSQAIEESFEDIQGLALQCKFSNCQHGKEPGCAISQAIQDNLLSVEKFSRYQSLLYEQGQSAKQMRQDERSNGRRKTDEPVRSVRRGK